jgi:integrase
MGRGIQKLSARSVAAASERGYYGDGGGLFLRVGPSGNKSWVFRFAMNKRPREMGLGALTSVSLQAARVKAAECRALVANRVDPISARKSDEACPTFDAATTIFIDSNKAGWKNAKHADQWRNTLATYASPKIGHMLVRDIQTADVMRVLSPIWQSKTETASRVRQRVEAVLAWAQVHGHRDTDNPARWRGHLDKILPKPSKVAKVVHHPAMPYADLPAFMVALREREGIAAACLEFTILTNVRTSEATGCVPDELDLPGHLWVIPPERMKAAKRHAVPLVPRAMEIIRAMPKVSGYTFPGPGKKELSENAMLSVLKRMKLSHYTVHGFRSSFRDWASDQTDYPSEVIEMALAHVVKDKTEAAYRRGELLDKRRKLAADWCAYLDGKKPLTKRVDS